MERAIVVGTGSAGRRHLQALREIAPGAELVAVRRPSSESPAPGSLADTVFDTIEEACALPATMAVVANAAPGHLAAMVHLIASGVPTLVEKPLSHRTDGVAEVLTEADRRGVNIRVAYQLRFSAPLQTLRTLVPQIGRLVAIRAEVGQHLEDWRPGTDYCNSVTANSALGGGALRELSHELDYVLWLAGKATGVSARVLRLSDLDINVEDWVEMDLLLTDGIAAHIHLDLLRRPPIRRVELIGRDGEITANLTDGKVQISCLDGKELRTINAPLGWQHEATLDMLRSFAEEPNEVSESICATGWEALAVLRLVEASERSSSEGRTILI